MIITVGGTKGGGGKTTIATNLAVMRARTGKDVLLIDEPRIGHAPQVPTTRDRLPGSGE